MLGHMHQEEKGKFLHLLETICYALRGDVMARPDGVETIIV
jgi:hypothetical protein